MLEGGGATALTLMAARRSLSAAAEGTSSAAAEAGLKTDLEAERVAGAAASTSPSPFSSTALLSTCTRGRDQARGWD